MTTFEQNDLQLPYYDDPSIVAAQLSELDGFIWLDSGHRSSNRQDSFDIISALPVSKLLLNSDYHVEIDRKPLQTTAQDYTQIIHEFITRYSQTINETQTLGHLPFSGGVIGYFSYEFLHPRQNLEVRSCDYKTPLVQLGAYNWAIVIDHKRKQSHWVGSKTIASIIKKRLSGDIEEHDFSCGEFSSNTQTNDYYHSINSIHNYLLSGDCYQVNYSQRFNAKYSGSEFQAYLQLRKDNAAPFSAYIKTDYGAILSCSPERFISAKKSKVMTQPIKGTSPRGKTELEDAENSRQLMQSQKNQSENLMIVDLMRNDFNKVCQPFSVTAPHLFELQSFANVHHLVSTVQGVLNEASDHFDLFLNCFPGGSITGAPKLRACQIISELENNQRHIYCGSIAYFSTSGKTDSNIAIRSFLMEQESIYCWGGGGIVMDSKPEDEHDESIYKVFKLMNTLSPLTKPESL